MTTDDFFLLVKKHLAEKVPFACVRYSDGEIMLMNRHEYIDEYLRAVWKLWGYVPDEEELKFLHAYLKESLLKADAIGFPTEKHLRRTDYFSKAISVFQANVGPVEFYKRTSVDIFYEFLASSKLNDSHIIYPDYFEELLRNQETLVYISCRNLDNELRAKYNIKNIYSYIIPGEPKFTSGYVGPKHFPHHFEKIREWVKEVPVKGNLCLVGGGVFSKIYNIWLKEQGGISLDIGAVFDLFAGKSTRGKNRGLDAIDNTYKL